MVDVSVLPNGAGTSSSQSVSSSFIPSYEEEPFLNQIAQYAGQVGNNVYNWAQNAYAGTSANTAANVGNYNTTTADALGQAANLQNQYTNILQPEENQLAQDANTYASTNRIQQDMGAAESGAAQAGETNRQNNIRDLQSYGIDPSAGRYAALDQASAVQNAATEAGAAQQARNFDITTGQQLRQASVNDAETKPGAVVNAINTGQAGITGAENASLANETAGAGALGTADQYFNTASSLKYPTLGNASESQSLSVSPASSGGGGGGSSPSSSPSSGGGSGSQSSPSGGGGGGTSSDGGGGGGNGATQIGAGPPEGDLGSSDPFDPSAGTGGSGDIYSGDPFGGGGGDAGSGYEGNALSDYGGDPFSGGDGTSDTSGSGYDDSAGLGGDGGGDFAGGGAIPDQPTTGGYVPPQASPSMGHQTDDVNANLNAGEFVIPKDVAAWKGQEFFQKLIAQSRKLRATSPAHPKPGPARPGPTNFASRPMR